MNFKIEIICVHKQEDFTKLPLKDFVALLYINSLV